MKRKSLPLLLFFLSFLFLLFEISAQRKHISSSGIVQLKTEDKKIYRGYVAGPEDAKSGVLFIHDFFGFSNAMEEAVQRLGKMGYRTLAVDLYNGQSATTNEAATELMQMKNNDETIKILKTGIDYLNRRGRKLGAIGFSAGGIEAMKATLMEPGLFGATIIVYGGNYDKIERADIDKLRNPVLSITGTADDWAVNASLNFFVNNKDKSFEMYFYPNGKHGYAQPLFLKGKNYDKEATRITWMLIEDFLKRNLEPE